MNPFIVSKAPEFAIVDYRANEQIIKTLEAHNLKIVKTIPCNDIQEPVCGHPDMVMHPIDRETLVIAPNVYDYYCEKFKNTRIKTIKGGKTLNRNYPEDIAYNVARIGNYAIHNFKYTDTVLKSHLDALGIKLISVNQGYTKCSLACISDDKAITSDVAIQKALADVGIECLLYNPTNIVLNGFNYGFIGGSVGNISDSTFLLSGYIEDNQERERLYSFVEKTNLNIEVASTNPLTDYGTIIVLWKEYTLELLSVDLDRSNSLSYFDNINNLTKLKSEDISIFIDTKNSQIDRIVYSTDKAIEPLVVNGEKTNSFIEEISSKITKIVKDYIEKSCFEYFDTGYFYFEDEEKEEIQKFIRKTIYTDDALDCKITDSIKEFLLSTSCINILGFIKFRLKFIENYSSDVVEKSIDNYLITKEYTNFLSFIGTVDSDKDED